MSYYDTKRSNKEIVKKKKVCVCVIFTKYDIIYAYDMKNIYIYMIQGDIRSVYDIIFYENVLIYDMLI